MGDLGSSLRGLGQWAQKWGFSRRGGVSGFWTVEKVGTGLMCHIKITRELAEE